MIQRLLPSALHPRLFYRGAHQRRAVVNRRLGAGLMQALASEAGFVHLGVGGDDHQISGGDILGGQGVFRPDRTLGFHLDHMALTFRALLQTFGGHEGMRDAGRTGSDADDLQAGSGG